MNEIQQMSFNYNDLAPAAQIAARTAAERIKMRLRRTAEDIVEIGRELTEIKFQIGHGKFLPWIEAEFDMSDRTANNFMQVANRFKSEIIADFKPTILYLLAAPSTPDEVIEKATEKAEAGEKVSVEDVKRWKAELEQAREHAQGLEVSALRNQQKAEFLQKSYDAAQKKIDELSSKEPQVITETITKEVLPPDYEAAKERARQLEEQLDEVTQESVARFKEAEEIRQKLAALKKKQEQEINSQVEQAIKLHEKELADMERKRDQAATRLDELQKHIAAMGAKAEASKFHDNILGEWEHELIELSLIIAEFEYVEQTSNKWLRMAKNFEDAAQAIRAVIESGKAAAKSLNSAAN